MSVAHEWEYILLKIKDIKIEDYSIELKSWKYTLFFILKSAFRLNEYKSEDNP